MRAINFKVKNIFLLNLLLFLYIMFLVPAHARIVRIPSWETFEFLCDDRKPMCREYYESFLNLIADRCNWQFEYYTEKTLESFEKVKKGKLDLVYDIARTPEREADGIIFSKYPCLTAHIFLVCPLQNAKYNNSNLESLNGSIVGYASGDPVQKQLLENFAFQNALSIHIQPVPYEEDRDLVFENERVDLCMTTRMSAQNFKHKIIHSFSTLPLYFASSNPQIIEELNAAVEDLLKEDPLFLMPFMYDSISEQIFIENNLTTEETIYAKNTKGVTLYDDDLYLELDKDFDVKKEYWSFVSSITGTKFNIDARNTEITKPGLYEVATEKRYSSIIKNCYTDTFYSMRVRLICTPGKSPVDFMNYTESPTEENNPCIAITPDIVKTLPFFENKFKDFDYIILDNAESCLKLLSNKGCDAALINNAYLQRYRITDYKRLRNQHSPLFEVPMCIFVNMSNPELMVSILNRAFAQLPKNYYMEELERRGIYVQSKMSTERLFNWIMGIFLVSLFMVFLYSIIINAIHNKKLKKQIEIDPLTNIFSLAGFEHRAEKILHSKQAGLYMLSEINIRDFAFVNRLYGTGKGDRILCCIAAKLNNDFYRNKRVVIAHGYADRFYIFQKLFCNKEEALAIMKDYQSILQEFVGQKENLPIIIKSGNIFFEYYTQSLNASAVIKDLISKASYARRHIHDSMVDNFCLYDEQMQRQHENEERIESTIENAIKNNEFVVQFQPKIDLRTEKIKGAEALVRWKNPDGSLIPPDTFIPVLEKNGLVGILDMYVYRYVFSFLHILKAEGLPLVPISVNISRLSHDLNEFVANLNSLCSEFEVQKKYIELEIEERFAGGTDSFVIELINSLHSAGFTVSMDDFGSGQSSLNMLSEMPVDVIKFDQRFLHYADSSEASKTILRYMVQMVNDLGKTSLCEGAETEQHVELLKDIGCSLAQGFFYARPLNEADFRAFLLSHV